MTSSPSTSPDSKDTSASQKTLEPPISNTTRRTLTVPPPIDDDAGWIKWYAERDVVMVDVFDVKPAETTTVKHPTEQSNTGGSDSETGNSEDSHNEESDDEDSDDEHDDSDGHGSTYQSLAQHQVDNESGQAADLPPFNHQDALHSPQYDPDDDESEQSGILYGESQHPHADDNAGPPSYEESERDMHDKIVRMSWQLCRLEDAVADADVAKIQEEFDELFYTWIHNFLGPEYQGRELHPEMDLPPPLPAILIHMRERIRTSHGNS